MSATVIAERIGWERSVTVLREKVAQLRPLYLPQDPTSRTSYEPAGRVQDDFWFPPAEIPLGHGKVAAGAEVPPVLVMASGTGEVYARAVKEWMEFLAAHGVGPFDSRERLKLGLSRYARAPRNGSGQAAVRGHDGAPGNLLSQGLLPNRLFKSS